MRELYPDIRPYATRRLPVSPLHTLYVEETGTPGGLPVLFLHGGPGAGCQPVHRRFFDPLRYRIVLFDQRGAGQSTPHAELTDNTTTALIADIELLRKTLGIERWVVFGGSWGSTLALAYAEAHPERVLGLVLRGIFLCRPQDIRWFYQSGAGRLFPEAWEDYLAPIPETERGDLVSAYYRRLTGDDEVERMRCAKAWSVWEGTTLTLRPSPHTVDHFADPHMALSLARIECHYFMHDSFLAPDQLVRDVSRLAGIPGYIVHGRYDVICPLDGAWALHRAWPGSQLDIIADAGHAATEPGIIDALVRATDALADHYR
ncbi:prolyl aminopeptidase [Plasticicumulans sp.]|uniref:prolyl aminopeptidase n=1 Tax=Plasticicumulans sp. TaxID=2307179 RepID=UPI002C2410FE|nr:prolyl aminopeptidase [Plasticicumulans sp.]MBS0602542.1 prolyl aminopeptidase [Pseudomonadota bacterium]HMV40806.1 prolyl aminopeptidase [Plasticicumulans sp.]HMW30000.1 prolyl aminopeptidase [Plasticicumulans sp.]HMW41327.1 prolyl aminopeptidase [Plasticicumulans sp.]HMZ09327.1 prolyl aminopeptidase [Plasticicumulans sp.]